MSNHIYVPVGYNCNTAWRKQQEGTYHVSYPFDWVGQTYDSICSILDDGGYVNAFINYELGVETYTIPSLPGKTLRTIFDYTHQFVAPHDYYEGVDIATIREKYQRMYDRLVRDLGAATDVTLYGSYPTTAMHDKGAEYYQTRLGIDIRNFMTFDKTLDDVADRIATLAPDATIHKIEDVVEEATFHSNKPYTT